MQNLKNLMIAVRGYVCRACGTECSYPERFKKCPVCGIHWG